MQIFYFRKKTFKWVIVVAVIVIISIILFWKFGIKGQELQSTLRVAQINTMLH